MYARTVGGRPLSFGVSGLLFRDALVMYDRETDTLWTQVDGQAIRGPLAGRTLEPLAAVHATWKEWKALYPDSLVLRKRNEFRSSYETYNNAPRRLGIFGRRDPDTGLPPKTRILGIRAGRTATAFPLAGVRQARIVNTLVGDLTVVLAAPADGLPIAVYERRVANRVLTFALVEGQPTLVRDIETGTRWRLSDGAAIDGALAGSRLTRAVAHPAFWFGWRGYMPDSTIWQPTEP